MPVPSISSKLPHVGTTIFSVMSALAQKHQAVNLGQGFPNFDCDPKLIAAVTEAMQQGHNQYPPMPGVEDLRRVIASKVEATYGRRFDPAQEITITAGATQAILTTLLAMVQPGDEVIVLDPCYDSYVPSIELAGGVAVRVPLSAAHFEPDFSAIAAALSARTRAIIINTPHNPSGRVWSAKQMQALAELLRGTSIVLISDEVYEHMVYAPLRHESVCRYPELSQRAVVITSFGKTFHVTGWKVGAVMAPKGWMSEFRKVHQFNVFTVNTPMQVGLAHYLQDSKPYLALPDFYQRKRDRFRAGLAQTRFELLPCEGTYFQCVNIRSLAVAERNASEADFCRWLTEEIGVAAIPLSAFYGSATDQGLIRFCFAKIDETLDQAIERLQGL